MQTFDLIQEPTQVDALVSFFDLTAFFRYSRGLEPATLFSTMDAYYELAGDILETAGGKIVKFIGDAGLVVFADERVNEGTLALIKLKEVGDAWWAQRDARCKNVIKVHYGPVCFGPIGTRTDKRFDVFGETVSTAATLHSNGFALSAQAFRQLDAKTRKYFKKHTPPITYIPLEESHKG
jgi:adenylate cyclase